MSIPNVNDTLMESLAQDLDEAYEQSDLFGSWLAPEPIKFVENHSDQKMGNYTQHHERSRGTIKLVAFILYK